MQDERPGEVKQSWHGWRRCAADPALLFATAAARLLVDAAADSTKGLADLRPWLVVVPGARAGRLLLHAIVSEASGRGLGCDVPEIATLGRLTETLWESPADAPDVASPLERRLAWEATLRAKATGDALPFVPRGSVPDRSLWRRVAEMALRCEDDLAAAERSFEDAAGAVERLGADALRLRALAAMSKEMESRLASVGLATPQADRAARVARGRRRFDRCALVGTLELSAAQRRAVEGIPVGLAIVGTREANIDRFDPHGAATPAWSDAPIDIPSASIVTAETPRDAAEWALRFIADRQAEEPGLACDEVTIGITAGPDDPGQAMELAVAARDAGLDIHDAAGVPLLATSVGRSIAAAARYRSLRARPGRSMDELAALVRRPNVERLLRDRCGDSELDPVALVDEVRGRHLASSIDALPSGAASDSLRSLVAILDAWSDELAGGHSEALLALRGAFAGSGSEREREEDAIRAFEQIVGTVGRIPAPLVGESETLDLVLELAAGTRLPAEPRERAVEAIGWLELLFEPARHIVVLGMNEGSVPSGGKGDGLLPESVRETLGMQTCRRRADRDAALLDLLVARSRSLRLVAARRTEEGDPIAPSRLLLRLGGVALAERVVALASEGSALVGQSRWRRIAGGHRGFVVPVPPESAREIERIGVTDFRAFLASPMRHWLGRIERLEEVDDDPSEIPVPDLGTIVHAALGWLANDPQLRSSTESDRIAEAVIAEFDRRARETFGRRPLPAVRLQLEILRRRLSPWAQWQARSAWDGWETIAVESSLPETFTIQPTSGKPVRVVGRIDRIDRHRSTGAIRIIDFKTSDAGKSPRETHRAGKKGTGEWRDLQLPLYVAGMRPLHGDGVRIESGYVRLAADPKLAGWIAADFTAEEMNEALGIAVGVLDRIRAGEWALGDALGPVDPFAGILQCAIFGRDEGGRQDGDESGEGDES